jgi:hypothetical protein
MNLVYGSLRLNKVALAAVDNKFRRIRATLGGSSQSTRLRKDQDRLFIDFNKTITIGKGQTLILEIT